MIDHNEFRRQQREYLFLSIARFSFLNRPKEGYYFEFGCHMGRTMRMAWEATKDLFDWTFVAFDSFAGLPEIPPIDRQPIWQQGGLATSEDDIVTGAGLPHERLRTVKGFYEESLTRALAADLRSHKAAVIFVDCDLYSSTVPVLRFCREFFQPGTVIAFDDWFCFHGDPERGERRAWREFCEANPELRFEKFVHTNEAQAFIYLGDGAHADGREVKS